MRDALKLQAAVHADAIMAALVQKFGSAPIDTARLALDASPQGLFLGISVDGERIFENPDVAEIEAAEIDAVCHGTGITFTSNDGRVKRIDPADFFARPAKKEGAGL